MKNREFKKMLVATMVGTMTMSMAAGCANQSDSKSAKADTSTVKQERTNKKSIDLDTEDEVEQSAKGIGSSDLSLGNTDDTVSDQKNEDPAGNSADNDTSEKEVVYTIALNNKDADAQATKAAKKTASSNVQTTSSSVKKNTTTSNTTVKKNEDKKTEIVNTGSTKKDEDSKPSDIKKDETGSETPSQPEQHVHHWVSVAEKGHYDTVVITPAYEEPVWGTGYVFSDGYTCTTPDEAVDHSVDTGLGYRTGTVQIGSIHHNAVTKQVYVKDSDGYEYCDGCNEILHK